MNKKSVRGSSVSGCPQHTSETPPMNLAFVFPPIYISVKQEAMAG